MTQAEYWRRCAREYERGSRALGRGFLAAMAERPRRRPRRTQR